MKRQWFRLIMILGLLAPMILLMAGCAAMKTTGKVVATPLTVVRDVVDAPLAGVTNLSENFARNTRPAKSPHVNVGWSIFSGFNPSIGYDISHYFFKGTSYLFGGVDYLICRSIWPDYPEGVSPWKEPEDTWGSLFFPNTKALWPSDSTQAGTSK